MKVKLKTCMCGPKGSFRAGDIITVEAQNGKDLISGGYADMIMEDRKVETASIEQREVAVARVKKPLTKTRG